MTWLSWVLSFFPMIVLGGSGISLLLLILQRHIGWAIAAVGLLYALPLCAYRLHLLFFPIPTGISRLKGQDYSPWWGSHQFQVIYIAFPMLETVLRLVPGLFSLWLRLWGAQVGRGVYWTPGLEIADRGLLEIGDRVVFGHRVGLYSHIIKPRNHDLVLYVKPIHIGSDVFLGAGTHIAPGAMIESGSYLTVNSHIYPNQKISGVSP
jgi:hypothetical protein